MWHSAKPKIKHNTLCSNFENGGLKNVDINFKIKSLQCSWIKKLYDENFHEWKIIPLYLINKYFGNNFKFHSNLSIDKKILKNFPKYYEEIFMSWSNHFSSISEVPSCILSSVLWNNCSIRINRKPITFRVLSNQNLIYLHQLFDNNGRIKNWDNIKSELELNDFLYFQWRQLVHSIPQKWKLIIKDNYNDNLLYSNYHLIKKNNVLSLDKLNAKELY